MGLLGDVLTDIAGVIDELSTDIFPETFTVERATNTKSNQGGTTKTWDAVAGMDAVPCLVEPMRGRETVVAERRRNAQPMKVTMPSSIEGVTVDVVAKDRLVIDGRGTESERTLYVDSVGRQMGVVIEIVAFYEE